MKGWFHVDEPRGDRWELALDLLRRGDTVALAGVGVSLAANRMLVSVPSRWRDRDSVTEQSARQDLERGAAVVEQARAASREFSDLAPEQRTVIELMLDYDTGAIKIAELVDGDLVWET